MAAQLSNFHITRDGKIFSVANGGEVTQIASVNSEGQIVAYSDNPQASDAPAPIGFVYKAFLGQNLNLTLNTDGAIHVTNADGSRAQIGYIALPGIPAATPSKKEGTKNSAKTSSGNISASTQPIAPVMSMSSGATEKPRKKRKGLKIILYTLATLLILWFVLLLVHPQQGYVYDNNVAAADSVSVPLPYLNDSQLQEIRGTMIYSCDSVTWCDGRYSYGENLSDASWFHVDLGDNLNRNHFSILADFYPTDNHRGIILSLSRGWRILKIGCGNGIFWVNVNVNDNYWSTEDFQYTPDSWNRFHISYHNGILTVNGKEFYDVPLDQTNGDNNLTSWDFSSGDSFNGYICNVQVWSSYSSDAVAVIPPNINDTVAVALPTAN